MSLSENGLSAADIALLSGNRNSGGFGDGLYGIVVLFFLIAMLGNGGFGGFGGFGGNGGAGNGFVNAEVQRGFDQSAVIGAVNGVQASVNAIPNQLCNGFAGVNQTVSTGFATAEVADNARQMANMQQGFSMQTAIGGQLDGIQQQLASCCCENRLALANLNSTILAENCADRQALSDGVRDILAATSAQTQSILTQMCNDKIDSKNEQIVSLQNQLNMASLAASQAAQTAQLEEYIASRTTTTAAA